MKKNIKTYIICVIIIAFIFTCIWAYIPKTSCGYISNISEINLKYPLYNPPSFLTHTKMFYVETHFGTSHSICIFGTAYDDIESILGESKIKYNQNDYEGVFIYEDDLNRLPKDFFDLYQMKMISDKGGIHYKIFGTSEDEILLFFFCIGSGNYHIAINNKNKKFVMKIYVRA